MLDLKENVEKIADVLENAKDLFNESYYLYKKYGEEKDVLDKKRHEQIWINKIETHRWSFVWVWRRGRNEVIKSLIKKNHIKTNKKWCE